MESEAFREQVRVLHPGREGIRDSRSTDSPPLGERYKQRRLLHDRLPHGERLLMAGQRRPEPDNQILPGPDQGRLGQVLLHTRQGERKVLVGRLEAGDGPVLSVRSGPRDGLHRLPPPRGGYLLGDESLRIGKGAGGTGRDNPEERGRHHPETRYHIVLRVGSRQLPRRAQGVSQVFMYRPSGTWRST